MKELTSWLDGLRERALQAKRLAEPAAPDEPQQPKQIRSCRVETRGPSGPGDPGAVEEVFFFIDGGELTLCDRDGAASRNSKPHRLAAGEDERRIAGRLWLQVWRSNDESNFNRRIIYPRSGVA
jgi:hypothetical protein